jgi:hypothetical protein
VRREREDVASKQVKQSVKSHKPCEGIFLERVLERVEQIVDACRSELASTTTGMGRARRRAAVLSHRLSVTGKHSCRNACARLFVHSSSQTWTPTETYPAHAFTCPCLCSMLCKCPLRVSHVGSRLCGAVILCLALVWCAEICVMKGTLRYEKLSFACFCKGHVRLISAHVRLISARLTCEKYAVYV